MSNSLEPTGFLSERISAHAVWHWRLLDATGAEMAPEVVGAGSARFTSQSDAETWVGESWRELAEQGVDAVTLLEADREVYGPMSLRA